MHDTFVDYYEQAIGPLIGVNGTDLRLVIGGAQVVAAVGTLFALWATALGIVTGELRDLADALLLCAMQGMILICFGGAIVECMLGALFPGRLAVVLGVLWFIVWVCRYRFVTPPGEFLTFHLVMYTGFQVICAVGTFAAVFTRCWWGAPLDELRKLIPNFNKRFDEALGSAPPVEPSGVEAPLTK